MNIKKRLVVYTLFLSIYSTIAAYYPHQIINLDVDGYSFYSDIHEKSNSVVLLVNILDSNHLNSSVFEINRIDIGTTNHTVHTKKMIFQDHMLIKIKMLSKFQQPMFISTWQPIPSLFNYDVNFLRNNFGNININNFDEIKSKLVKTKLSDPYPYFNAEEKAKQIQNELHKLRKKEHKTSVVIFDTNGNKITIATISEAIAAITTNKDETKLFCTTEDGEIAIVDIPTDFKQIPNPPHIEFENNTNGAIHLNPNENKKEFNKICVSPNCEILATTQSKNVQRDYRTEATTQVELNIWNDQLEPINHTEITNIKYTTGIYNNGNKLGIDINYANQILIYKKKDLFIYNPYTTKKTELASQLIRVTRCYNEIAKAEFVSNSNYILVELRGEYFASNEIHILDYYNNKFKFTIKISSDSEIQSSKVDKNNVLHVVARRRYKTYSPEKLETYLLMIPLSNISPHDLSHREQHGKFLYQNKKSTKSFFYFDFDKNNQPIITHEEITHD